MAASLAPTAEIVLVPDAGPLITLAYADSLDLLLKPGWSVRLVDMGLHEATRNQTPTSEKLSKWVQVNQIPILPTQIYERYQELLSSGVSVPRKSNLGELAVQEAMNQFALDHPPRTGVFLFEDHKIARASFVVPDVCRKVSTRAFLLFLGQEALVLSAAEIERRAIQAGRSFSELRFPA